MYLKKDILKNLIKILSIFLFLEHQKKHILRKFNRYRNIDEDDDRDTFPLFNEISSNPESESYLQTFVDNVRINTDINFVSKTNSFSQNDLSYLNATYVDKSLSLELPIKFNWAKTTSADSPDVVAKKKLISKPDNQYYVAVVGLYQLLV